MKKLTENGSSMAVCRFVLDGRIFHICHFSAMCEDNNHILGCIKDIEQEFIESEQQEQLLRSAELLANLDKSTGVQNKNAFTERVDAINEILASSDETYEFGVVMCDINDLKLINDTRGHSFGDETIQVACRLISGIFENSMVYRVGGDEFAVILMGEDYENRNQLLVKLKTESEMNRRWRSGPVIACGMATYNADVDKDFYEVFERADGHMYEDKKDLKAIRIAEETEKPEKPKDVNLTIPDERKRLLDRLYGAMYAMVGDGYVFLTDLKYDYSRWSLSLINDFGLDSEYMYHVERIWEDCIHPDDVGRYLEVVDAVLRSNSVLYSISYRARKADGTYVVLKPRGFVLNDENGEPEYFGGIIVPQ